jgi:MFS family permease
MKIEEEGCYMFSEMEEKPAFEPLDLKKFVPWIVFVIFFAVLNETVFNVSTPKIAAQYDLSPTGVSWVLTVFIITFGIGSVVYGKLADIFSVRKLIGIGIGIYCLGSIIGFALQHWYAAVIVGRAIQGAGASAIPALVMVVVARYFTQADRSKLFGILFVLPLLLNHVHELNTDRIGLLLFPGAFSAVIFGTIAGRMTAKRGSHYVVYIGIVLVTAALLSISVLTDNWVWLMGIALIPMYIGFSFVQTALAESITQVVPQKQIGVGMGFYGLVAFIAGAVGTASVARLLDQTWLDSAWVPFISNSEAQSYSNLIFAFTMIIAISGLVYLFSLGRPSRTRIATQN